MRTTAFIAFAGLSALAACGGFAVKGQQTPYGASIPTMQRPAPQSTAAKSGAKGAQSRTVCRASGIEPGWIAVDYVNDAKACDSSVSSSKAHPAAIIVNYRLERVGDELDVCADQMVPAGWVISDWLPDNGSCPDDPPSDRVTVKRIRRIS